MGPGNGSGRTSGAATTRSRVSGGTGSRRTARRCLPPLGGDETGPDPTNRGKRGTTRHVLTDRRGAPLGATISAANRNDMKVAEATLDSVAGARPRPTPAEPQHLCRDKGFDVPETRHAAEARGYTVHTPRKVRKGKGKGKGADPPPPPPEEETAAERHPPRRWVIERTNGWHNRFRKLRIRY